MIENIEERFNELISAGQNLIKAMPADEDGPEFWIPERSIAEYQRWIASSANLINLLVTQDSTFGQECAKILGDKNSTSTDGITSRMVQKIYGLLSSARDEWQRGLLRKIEYLVAAETFDDFLDHAHAYHKGNKKIEASVLASAILEDTVKKIAKKNGLESKGIPLETLIDEIVKAGTFTPVKAKRVKAFSGGRNHALHAEWDEFDIKDVGNVITGIRELIDTFL